MSAKLTAAQINALNYYADGGDCLQKGAPRTNVAWALHTAGLLKVTRGIRGHHIDIEITDAGRTARARCRAGY